MVGFNLLTRILLECLKVFAQVFTNSYFSYLQYCAQKTLRHVRKSSCVDFVHNSVIIMKKMSLPAKKHCNQFLILFSDNVF